MEKLGGIFTCEACKISLKPIDLILTEKLSQEFLELIAEEICVTFKIYGGDRDVCKGAIDLMANILLPAIADGVLSSNRVCDELLHLCSSPNIIELNA